MRLGSHCSIETKKKMSEAQMGKTFSAEHKRKISEACMGKIRSIEMRRKMSEAHKRKNPNWKGERTFRNGYIIILCKDHPCGRTQVKEERLIVEKHLGRYLRPEEIVHHKNGDKQDNRLANLQVVNGRSEHTRLHATGRPVSEETRQKMREANIGKILSEEHKRKLSESHTGKTHSEETRQKMREAHFGKHYFKETK